jgi:uncharacterized membrane protein YcaP (DUF421 family)
MDTSWLTTSWSAVLMIIITAIGIYMAIIVLTKVAGLRSFSKMSSFDFPITIAYGAIIGSVIVAQKPPLLQAALGLVALFVIQIIISHLRGQSSILKSLVDNEPLLLMHGTEILEDNLKKARVTHNDLHAKLREANVTQLHQVHAVIMESTGDISVMHHEDPDHKLDDELLQSVRDWG